MADHYYTNEPASPHDTKEIAFVYRGKALCFETDAGMFSRERIDPGSVLLMEAMGMLRGRVADIGCGWGAIGLSLAAANPAAEFVLADVNRRAVEMARRNAERMQLSNVTIVESDGLLAVEGAFDAIVTNPPVRAGKAVVHRFFAQAHEKLVRGGSLSVVLRKAQGAPSAKAYMTELFGHCETVSRGGGYHILRSVL